MADKFGEASVNQLWAAASSGQLTMEPDAAREVAQSYFRYAEQCAGWIEKAQGLEEIHGFGSLISATQLQDGFAGKARGLGTVLLQVQESARRMGQAYLQSANILSEADQLQAAAVRSVANEVR